MAATAGANFVGGLSEEQRSHISTMIRDALAKEGKPMMDAAGAQVQESLASVLKQLDEHHATKSAELEAKMNEKTAAISRQQTQMVELLRQAEESYKGIQQKIAEKETQLGALMNTLAQQEQQKERAGE